MNAWEEYLARLRELDAVRTAHARTTATEHDHRRSATDALDGLTHRLSEQRDRLSELSHHCRLSPLPTHPPPVPASPPGHAVDHVRSLVDTAEAAYGQARYLAHRPKLLPRWRSDERNGLIYGVWALIGLFASVAILSSTSTDGSLGDVIGVVIAGLIAPACAFTAGWLTIGVVARPTLGDPVTGPGGRIDRNPRLGIVICASTLIVMCWLGSVYLY
ncbi:hypothetical protein [Stackebrandtia soli]|uniref:hypothetical protein n=1 Tax=Stackebrandtia soli TaxID=1892856 RepID=UPI0039EC4F46